MDKLHPMEDKFVNNVLLFSSFGAGLMDKKHPKKYDTLFN
jgi:hypothetical protein